MRMQQHRFDIGPPDWGAGTRLLLILSALGGLVAFFLPQDLAVTLAYPSLAYPWSLATSVFVTGGAMPFIVTAIMLWMFGNSVEAILGKQRQLGLYVGAGVVGNLAAVLFSRATAPMMMGFAPNVGSGYSIEALFLAWAFFHRDLTVRVMFLVPVNAWHLVYFSLAVALLSTLSGSPTGFGSLVVALGVLTYLSRRRHGTWNPFGDLQRKAHDAYRKWSLKRKASHLQVLKAGKGDAFVRDEDAPGRSDGKPPVIH